jgi:hypothetical protein
MRAPCAAACGASRSSAPASCASIAEKGAPRAASGGQLYSRLKRLSSTTMCGSPHASRIARFTGAGRQPSRVAMLSSISAPSETSPSPNPGRASTARSASSSHPSRAPNAARSASVKRSVPMSLAIPHAHTVRAPAHEGGPRQTRVPWGASGSGCRCGRCAWDVRDCGPRRCGGRAERRGGVRVRRAPRSFKIVEPRLKNGGAEDDRRTESSRGVALRRGRLTLVGWAPCRRWSRRRAGGGGTRTPTRQRQLVPTPTPGPTRPPSSGRPPLLRFSTAVPRCPPSAEPTTRTHPRRSARPPHLRGPPFTAARTSPRSTRRHEGRFSRGTPTPPR